VKQVGTRKRDTPPRERIHGVGNERRVRWCVPLMRWRDVAGNRIIEHQGRGLDCAPAQCVVVLCEPARARLVRCQHGDEEVLPRPVNLVCL